MPDATTRPFAVVYDGRSDKFLAIGEGGHALAEIPASLPTRDRPARQLLAEKLEKARAGVAR